MFDSIQTRLKEFHNRNVSTVNNITLLDQLDMSKQYELVLVDAPCTGSGTVRRNPDKKHTITRDTINQFAKTQLSILNDYSKFLSIGGSLIYVTCSLFNEENIKVIDKFLETNPNFEPMQIESNTINDYSIKISNFANILIPINYNGDIFFIATLKKLH